VKRSLSFDFTTTGAVKSVAILSMHTSPLAQAGSGDGGGLNIYVRELATSMAHLGISCDVYVRRSDDVTEEIVEIEPGLRVIQIEAGPSDLLKEDLPLVIDSYTDKVRKYLEQSPVDAIHAHYWLSAVAGHQLKHELEIPLAVTFHTLGRVKVDAGESEPIERITAEEQVIGCADAVFASGEVEATQLARLYDVPFDRIKILTPGVDRALFSPGQQWAARQAINLGKAPMLLFVGRIQPLKGIDLAIASLSQLRSKDAFLVVVGGPSGAEGEKTMSDLLSMVDGLGLSERVHFVAPQAHHLLSTYYRAADVCLVPSHSESFGLVALEAAACGTPVVASDVGGLRNSVVDGVTGFLVSGRNPETFAKRIDQLIDDPLLAIRVGEQGALRAGAHTWQASASEAIQVFEMLSRRELVTCI